MKKVSKWLAVLSLSGGLLLAGCADPDEVDEGDLPAVEEPADDNVDDGVDDGLDGDVDDDTDVE